MTSLVTQNQSRISRAADYANEQTLLKVQRMAEQRDARMSEIASIAQYRQKINRELMIEKHQAQKLLSTVRDASPIKAQRVLKKHQFEMPKAQVLPKAVGKETKLEK